MPTQAGSRSCRKGGAGVVVVVARHISPCQHKNGVQKSTTNVLLQYSNITTVVRTSANAVRAAGKRSNRLPKTAQASSREEAVSNRHSCCATCKHEYEQGGGGATRRHTRETIGLASEQVGRGRGRVRVRVRGHIATSRPPTPTPLSRLGKRNLRRRVASPSRQQSTIK